MLFSVDAFAQQDSTKRKYDVLLLPVIARSIETSWSFGAASSFTFKPKAFDKTVRTSNEQAILLYSLRKQFIVAINGSIYFPGEKFIINHQFSYSYYPDKFWGIGPSAQDTAVEGYSYKQYYIYLHPQVELWHKTYIGLLYEFQRLFDVNYPKGGIFDREDINGRTGYHVSGLGLSFTYDTRNNAFSPDRGVMLQFYFNHFAQYIGSDFRYTNYVLDARKFIRTYKDQVLALQAYGFFNAGNVPLRSLALLGGANKMRGYYEGRYRDNNLAIVQAEYRVPIYWRIGAVAFCDIGNVSDKLDNFTFQNPKFSYGGGLRIALNKTEKLNLRLDYGIGMGRSSGFYVQLGEAF
ncbi:MAG: BamA/TamA family outer membrane protein [Bacteroidetes bacterium]|nr:BamA/TamA family outer membrane protein [Bacteroidota bacterium]